MASGDRGHGHDGYRLARTKGRQQDENEIQGGCQVWGNTLHGVPGLQAVRPFTGAHGWSGQSLRRARRGTAARKRRARNDQMKRGGMALASSKSKDSGSTPFSTAASNAARSALTLKRIERRGLSSGWKTCWRSVRNASDRYMACNTASGSIIRAKGLSLMLFERMVSSLKPGKTMNKSMK